MVTPMRLLFLHGAGMSREMWRPQLDALGGEFNVSAIDLPGHGSGLIEPFSFPAAVAAVEEAVAGGPPPVVVGLSLGGYVAMATVAKRPSMAAGLVLTGCSVDYSQGSDRRLARMSAGIIRVSPKWLLRRSNSNFLHRDYPEWAEDMVNAGYSWRGYADALTAATHIDWAQGLRAYDGPVLILNGENDKPHVREAAQLQSRFRDCRVELIMGAGHLANLDRPEDYSEAVRRFALFVAREAPREPRPGA
jgi:pimeloyl-ACP methyl ester carboxylesterase